MNQRLRGNVILLLTSTLLTLGIIEGLMRLTMNPADLAASFPTHPELNQWHNELRFLERYGNRPESELSSHDPVLGWDASYGTTRIRGREQVPDSPGLRALVLGDSFVYGNDVGVDENFASVLEAIRPGMQVLNMGVPGYGIDQSYLKFLEHGAGWQPDVVLFGIYVADYERSTMAFTASAKPLFVLSDSEVVLTNQPVPSPREELARIRAAFDNRLYLVEFIRIRARQLLEGATVTTFFDTSDRLIEHLLGDLARRLEPAQQLLIIHIPRGESFTAPDPVDEEMHRRLLGIYRRLELPYLDLKAEFLSTAAPEEVAATYYVVRPSGSVGHLNPNGHRFTAERILTRLHSPSS